MNRRVRTPYSWGATPCKPVSVQPFNTADSRVFRVTCGCGGPESGKKGAERAASERRYRFGPSRSNCLKMGFLARKGRLVGETPVLVAGARVTACDGGTLTGAGDRIAGQPSPAPPHRDKPGAFDAPARLTSAEKIRAGGHTHLSIAMTSVEGVATPPGRLRDGRPHSQITSITPNL
jgi:hypothetical protein